MGKALYRKYRSQNLGEIVGQDHITSTLSRALQDGKISHAYLLTGPKGVGKTSIARILAHEVNGLPYSEDPHLDIIEIDAASNRRIDEIRDLREHIHAAPASAKYKVFIIDEVHMLTKEAFNALLKTLEEPPAHVIFILATTETHKLPETIISRTQRYSFRPVPTDQVVAHLRAIAQKEKIAVDDDALELIAEHGEGSFRDSISLLDQASSSGEKITRTAVESILGRASTDEITDLVTLVATHKPLEIIAKLTAMFNAGFDAAILATQLGAFLRADLLAERSALFDAHRSLALLHDLLAVPGSLNAKQHLEITLMSHALEDQSTTQQTAEPIKPQAKPEETKPNLPEVDSSSQTKVSANEDEKEQGSPTEEVPQVTPNATDTKTEKKPITKPTAEEATQEATAKPDKPVKETTADEQELWEAMLNRIKRTHNTLYGVARMAKPRLEGDTLYLGLRFPFHHKQLNTSKNTAVLSEALNAERGKSSKLVLELLDNNTSQPKSADITTISNIFGGAELL